MIRTILILTALGAEVLFGAAPQVRFTTVYNFSGTYPMGLRPAAAGFYGATSFPYPQTGWNCGTVFQLLPPTSSASGWTAITLYSFASSNDACFPFAAPTVGTNGALYGTTVSGGTYNLGALYELQPPAATGGMWAESLPYSFPPSYVSDVGSPSGYLIPAPGGSFYALTSGGANQNGALVQLQPPSGSGGTWTATVLYSFPPATGGNSLTPGPNGTIYATMSGLVMQLTPPSSAGGSWTGTVLYTFPNYGEGNLPNSVTVGSGGVLYGTTYGSGGIFRGAGVVFELTPPAASGGSWNFTMVHNFGADHLSSPVILRNGNLYGALDTVSSGVIYELTPPSSPGATWGITYLHQFTNYQQPFGNLIMDQAGTIFGVTQAAYGQPASGAVFAIATK